MKKLLLVVCALLSYTAFAQTPTPVPYAVNGFGQVPTVFVNLQVPVTPTPTPYIPTANLEKWFKFDEGDGTTSYDYGPWHNEFISLKDANWTTGGYGLDASYIVTEAHATSTQAMTWAVVMKSDWTCAGTISGYTGDDPSEKWAYFQIPGTAYAPLSCGEIGYWTFYTHDTSGNLPCVSKSVAGWTDNTWHLVVGRLNSSLARMCFDVAQVDCINGTLDTYETYIPLTINWRNEGTSCSATIGYFVVWLRALDDSEISIAAQYIRNEMSARGVVLP